MKSKQVVKITAVFFVVLFFGMSLCVVNFGNYFGSAGASGYQPYNSFTPFSQPTISEQENDQYGWNMTYIKNLNGDPYRDLVIGAPWYDDGIALDIGAVFIFYGKVDLSFQDLSHAAADVIIIGEADGDRFGWDVAGAGDVNGDGLDDLIVGAPWARSGHGRAYLFYGGNLPTSANDAHRRLDGFEYGIPFNGHYGTAVSTFGDINGDGYADVIVGAPGVDQAIITYGYKNKVTIYPNLWGDQSGQNGMVEFDDGANNTVDDLNTWGRTAGDDGWDWIDSYDDPSDLYGQTYPAAYDNAFLYGPWEPDGPDADGLTMNNRSALEVMIGRNHTSLNPYNGTTWSAGASAAWGIEFTINNMLYNYISKNSSIEIGFNYETMDANVIYNASNLSKRYIYTIRSRIWNATGMEYLGDEVVNNNRYLFYKQDNWNVPPWGPIFDHFTWDITDNIDRPGSYYWDFGNYFDRGWSMRNDDGMITFFDNITMKIQNEKNVVIQGMEDSGFGTSITSIGDINNDGLGDVLIGAPNMEAGHVAVFNGRERFKKTETINLASTILIGSAAGDKFGYSVSPAGDVDDDGILDVIIGAPGGNYANLYFGSSLQNQPLLPDLWEAVEDSATPQIEFDSGLKTTGNTPGLSGADDGWEIWNGVYGFQSGGTAGSSVKYNSMESVDPATIAQDDELIIAIGGGAGGGSTVGAKPDSGAYGLEFTMTQAMISAIEAGGEAVLSFDWRFENIGLDQDETIWMKASITNNSGSFSLGRDLDKNAGIGANKDDTNEIHWADAPYDIENTFIQECTEVFTHVGSYYLDVGAKVRDYWWENSAWEDGIFHFDNIHLRINPGPNNRFIGPANSGFGYSVGYSKKLNLDDYGDIVIGAPYYDSVNGENSGAVFGFIMELDSSEVRSADTAEFVAYGEFAGDNFGWTILGDVSLDSDEFSEIITSAVNYDSTSMNVGKIYVLSISKGPRIRLIHPNGGEVLTGNVLINAMVIDPDNNVDLTLGVFFYYSTDGSNWETIGKTETQSTLADNYELMWDTTLLPDGMNYIIKGWVQDLDLNKGENFSLPVTINNPHPPTIELQTPVHESTVEGIVEISALIKDSEADLIGGGINMDKGVQFYVSAVSNQGPWDLIGSDNSSSGDIYSTTMDTTTRIDGEYWLRANVTDLDGFEVEQIIDIVIDNPNRAPELHLIAPLNVTELSGTVKLRANAFDMDLNINNSGITFCLASEAAPEQWWSIGNAPDPLVDPNGVMIYSMDWETITVPDHWYRMKAIVNDTDGFTNETQISEFSVHNNEKNPPAIEIISPINGKNVEKNQVIKVYVRDLDQDIDQNGVFYYYSSDKVGWHYLGNTPDPGADSNNSEYYNFYWITDTLTDGEYWLNVSVSDTMGHTSWDISDEPVIVHHTNSNPPLVKILIPTKGQKINGSFTLRAMAHDMEGNIDQTGVVFYYSTDGKDWNIISNVKTPIDSDKVYEMAWDTTVYTDGKYWLRADVKDIEGLTNQAFSDYFYIHNRVDNPPVVKYLSPYIGEIGGIIKIGAMVFDLENNIDKDGVKFYYSTDKENWQLIGNDPVGNLIDDEYLYEFNWDTNLVPDNIYWLLVQVTDQSGLTEFDTSENYIMVHNNLNNPPIILVKAPVNNVPLGLRESLIVEIIDFENDVEGVSFYYSKDNVTWVLIDTTIKPEIDNVFKIIWSTAEIENGDYFIKILARDLLGHSTEVVTGPFEVTQGITKETSKGTGESSDYLMSIIVIVIIVLIMIFVIFFLIKRSKKREKEIIAEVATELRHTMEANGNGNGNANTSPQAAAAADDIAGYPAEESSEAEGTQTYIPASKVTQTLNGQPLAPMATPVNAELAPAVQATLSTPATVPQLSQAQIDDILPEMLPNPEATVEPVQESDVPGDEELPPELEPIVLPSETSEELEIPISPFVAGCSEEPNKSSSEIPKSPFSKVQTQTLEEEIGGEADIVELPNEKDNI